MAAPPQGDGGDGGGRARLNLVVSLVGSHSTCG
jgi:hypothetical protein